MTKRTMRHLLPFTLFLLCSSCGGGGGESNSPVSPPVGNPPPVIDASYINLESDSGDLIGQGKNYSYSLANAQVEVTSERATLWMSIKGDEFWRGEFVLPNMYTRLEVGTYTGLTGYPGHDAVVGGMSWAGEGRACSTLSGSITISKVTYDGTILTEIEAQFDQYCGGNSTALRGEIYWNADDATTPPGPTASPADLWEPATSALPSSGNYVYLVSQAGDFIGSGNSYTYTEADSNLKVNSPGENLSVTVNGIEQWIGDFRRMGSIARLELGYYGGLQHYPFNNPAKGGLSWAGDGRGCSTASGWFVVDYVTYTGSALTAIDLRFEQYCDGGANALRGKIHWSANDATRTLNPVYPPPTDLWQPAAGITPEIGNYVYLESDAGDPIGLGNTHVFTQNNSGINVNYSETQLNVNTAADEPWTGMLRTMDSLSRPEVGYYGNLQRFGFHDPAVGGMNWSAVHRNCNTLAGWVVIDKVVYDGTEIVALDLRFEQRCDGGTAALRGEVHWDARDPTEPAGPPPPPDLWEPAPGATPESGNYLYFESEQGDFIGQGRTYNYTQADSVISASYSIDYQMLELHVTGDQRWFGRIEPMSSLSRLEAGYYGDAQKVVGGNPTKGGMNWISQARGCSAISGWFVIDHVEYEGNQVSALDMRFAQFCDGSAAALYGKIHWVNNDPTVPPGPVVPAPVDLWSPEPGTTPDTGNYVYLESEQGDYIGMGRNYSYTDENSTIFVSEGGAHFFVRVTGNEDWTGDFQAMIGLTQIEVGYYGDLMRYRHHNPARGGLGWSGEGRGCNTLGGWFVIDSVEYEGTQISAIDLRFEQRCENGDNALHGSIHWTQLGL